VKKYCATVGLSNSVESANVVGYNTINVKSDTWYLVAPQFTDVASENDAVDLLKVIDMSGVNAVAFANRATGAQIQIYSPASGGYTTYYYINNGRLTIDGQTVTGQTGWGRSTTLATTIPVTLGQGVWMKVGAAESGASITVKGAVTTATSKTLTVGASGTWDICCNPFPTAISWENVVTEGFTPVPFANRAQGAQLQVYNADSKGYTTYYYINNGRKVIDGQTVNNLTGWGRSTTLATGTFADVGQAFWVKAPTTGSLTFKISE
jgi:hypothetical protein